MTVRTTGGFTDVDMEADWTSDLAIRMLSWNDTGLYNNDVEVDYAC
jgi:hypothetical protein